MVGSQIPTTYQRNPALEFTKYIVHIFGLESKLQREVIVVRRNLLKILKISEFSPDSHFMEPCMVLRIPDVICDFCEFTKDLDICRDISIKNKNWACSVCGHNLSKANIERRLIDILQKKYISYQVYIYIYNNNNNNNNNNIIIFSYKIYIVQNANLQRIGN